MADWYILAVLGAVAVAGSIYVLVESAILFRYVRKGRKQMEEKKVDMSTLEDDRKFPAEQHTKLADKPTDNCPVCGRMMSKTVLLVADTGRLGEKVTSDLVVFTCQGEKPYPHVVRADVRL